MPRLTSIPRRAIVSIQPDPNSPFLFVNRSTAQNIIRSEHVGGWRKRKTRRKSLANACTFNPALCTRGGWRKRARKTRKN